MHYHEFYIDGKWVQPHSQQRLDVINPATEEVCGNITIGDEVDADRAVMAARVAFPAFSKTTKAERLDLLNPSWPFMIVGSRKSPMRFNWNSRAFRICG